MKRMIYAIVMIVVVLLVRQQIRTTSATSLPSSTVFDQANLRIIVQSVSVDHSPMKEQSFDVIVADADGAPIHGADVRMEIKMPKMLCGIFPATVREVGQGTFEATVVPVMKGKWEAETSVRIGKEDYTIRHSFAVN